MPQIVIIDDHPLIARGIASMLEPVVELNVVAIAENCQQAVKVFRESEPPDVAVVDLELPDGSGLELIKEIRSLSPETGILVSTMKSEEIYGCRCISAGALGFICKQEPLEKLVDGINAVAAGEIFVSEKLSCLLIKSTQKSADSKTGIDSLSDRELEVLELMGRGKMTVEIADRLFLSPKTVESYRERIKQKLGLRNMAELISFATSTVA